MISVESGRRLREEERDMFVYDARLSGVQYYIQNEAEKCGISTCTHTKLVLDARFASSGGAHGIPRLVFHSLRGVVVFNHVSEEEEAGKAPNSRNKREQRRRRGKRDILF